MQRFSRAPFQSHWLKHSSDSHGPLAQGVLLSLRAGRDAAAELRRHVWQRAHAAKVPCAWLDVGGAGTYPWRLEHLKELPRNAWPVMGQAHDWVSAWSWAEAWHQRMRGSWVVIEAEGEGTSGQAEMMPIAAPEGLSVARERRLRALLRQNSGRVVALTS